MPDLRSNNESVTDNVIVNLSRNNEIVHDSGEKTLNAIITRVNVAPNVNNNVTHDNLKEINVVKKDSSNQCKNMSNESYKPVNTYKNCETAPDCINEAKLYITTKLKKYEMNKVLWMNSIFTNIIIL